MSETIEPKKTPLDLARETRHRNILKVKNLKTQGYSNVAIGEKLGLSESSVRAIANL